MGYNAFSTHFAIYAIKHLRMTPSSISGPLLVRVFSVLIFAIPSAILSTKIGRKMTIRIGLVILSATVFMIYFLTPETAKLLSPIFIVYGIGFAMVSVQLGPMVVELCSNADVGRYMGYYYLATTVAQIITPAFAGIFLDKFGQQTIALYTAVFMAIGFVVTFFIKHGDSKTLNIKASAVLAGND